MTGKELVPVEYIDATAVTIVDDVSAGDETLIGLWLDGLPEHTQRAYRREIMSMLTYAHKRIDEVTLIDLQAYVSSLSHLKDSSKARAVAAIKSMYKRLHEGGYILFNPAALMRLPKVKDTMAQRYLTEEQVKAMLDVTTDKRNHAFLRLLYHTGMRVSEIVALTWDDVLPGKNVATLIVQGKGSKTRYVEIGSDMLDELKSVSRGGYIFKSNRGGSMTTRRAEQIVTDAAEQAGIDKKVSPHWLRHANASHTIAAGASIVEVRDNLGHASIAVTNKYAHSENAGKTSRFIKL